METLIRSHGPVPVEAGHAAVWQGELDAVKARLGTLFARKDARHQAGLYLEGLLSAVERKNGWQLAEYIGDARPWRTQRVLSQSQWDEHAARDLVREYVGEHLADADAVLVIDETGFLKKGTKSAGVARQYSGTAGRIENCQIGVFLAYASHKGHALIDRELYLPQAWAADAARRQEAYVPAEVAFVTKPQLAGRMIARALAAGLPVRWVLGDEVYGGDPQLRRDLEEQEQPFVLAVKSTQRLWASLAGAEPAPVAAKDLAARVPADEWQGLSAGAGAKGERLYDFARVRLAGPPEPVWEHWLLVRRSRSDGKLAFYVVFAPAATSLATLARVAGRRWTIEECFEAAKQETGLDEYEVRSYHGWYRHVTLSMLALAVLAVLRAKQAGKKGDAQLGRAAWCG